MVSFDVQKLVSLIRFHLFIFVFLSVALGDWLKKTLVWFMSEEVLPMLSSRSFMVSCLMFKSLNYLEFILVHGVRVCSNFIDLHAAVQLSQNHLLKWLSFSHFIFLPPFQSCKFLKGESFGEWLRVFIIFHSVQNFFWLADGEVPGCCSRNLGLNLKLPTYTWVGAIVPTEELEGIFLCIFLEEEPGPCPWLHYWFLTASLFLHPLPSLISNCLNLLFGSQGRSRRLNETYFLQTRAHKGFVLGIPTGSCSISLPQKKKW